MNPLTILRQRLLHGGGPFLGSRAFVLGPAVVERADAAFGHDSSQFQPPEFVNYLATSNNVYVCSRLRSQLLSSLPLKFYKLDRNGEKVEVTSGPLVELLTKVNPFWTASRLLEMIELSLCLWGEAFIFINRSERRREPRELWWGRADRVKVVPHATDYVAGFLYEPANGAQAIPYARDEVLWFRYPNPIDEYEGLSPLAAARLAADTASAAMQANRNLFGNGILAGGFISPKQGTFTKEQANDLMDHISRRFKGVDKAHRWGVLHFDAAIQPMTVSPRDAEFLGSLKWSLEEIARAYGIPLDLVGGQRTYENVQAAERALWAHTMRPEARFVANELTEQLLPMFPGQADLCEFDFGEVEALKEDRQMTWTIAKEMIQVGRKTINEVRAEDGEDPLPWGDAWWGPLNLVPITDAAVSEPVLPPVTTAPALPSGEDDEEEPTDEDGERRRSVRAIAYGSPEHQQRWRAFVRRTEPWERRFGEMTADLMRRQKAAVLSRLKQRVATPVMVGAPVGPTNGHRAAAEALDEPFDLPRWIKTFRTEARPIIGEIVGDAGGAAVEDLGLGSSFDVQDPNVIRAIEAQAQRYAREVNETTWDQIKTTLAEGIQAKEGIPALTDRVEVAMGGRVRDAAMIARTEVNAAANTGTLLSWKQSGVVSHKTWLASLDARVRPSHSAAHGQTVPIDKDFTVGAGSGPSPGQIGLRDEDIWCRCTMTAGLDINAPAQPQPAEPAPLAEGFDRTEWNKARKGLYDEWRKDATDDEVGAVTRYKGARYQSINKMLRTGNAPASQVADLKEEVRLIDRALSRSKVDRDVQAFRGVRFDWDSIPDAWANLQPGDIITDPGYVSTSTSGKAADKFAKKGNGSFLLDVGIPKESPGLWIDPLGDAQTKEDEILLPRGTRFLVRDVTKERNGRTKLKVEVVTG